MTIIAGDGFNIFEHGSNENQNGNGNGGKKARKTASRSSNRSGPQSKPTGPTKPRTTKAGPAKSETVKSESVKSESVKFSPAKSNTVKSKPAESKPVQIEPTESKQAESKPAESKPVQIDGAIDDKSTGARSAGEPADTDQAWSSRQIAMVARRTLAVFVVLGLVGYGLGVARGASNTARAEFVYSLDESIPDSFLREDRRLLTQLVTFKSDAVLTPVAAQFDIGVDALRSKIDVETLELSEVIRLDVSDADADRAVAINRAVLGRYLSVITDATPADDGQGLAAQRLEIAEQLAAVDDSRLALIAAQGEDITLELRQESIQRQVDLKNSQINLLGQSIDTADIQGISQAQQDKLVQTLNAAAEELVSLEADLIAVATQRAELATATVAQPALTREIERLESRLATIDAELAQRELGPLVASPIRELSPPLVIFHSSHLSGLQGMALGLLLAIPLAALVAYRSRKSQLWFA